MKQEQRVLEYLKTHPGITSLDAFREFGITRLSARIWNLRREGHEIVTQRVTVRNRYGEKITTALYILVNEDVWKEVAQNGQV